MKKIPILSVFAALSAFASPVIPGEVTDPSNIRKATESLPGDWYVAPEHLKFPYISTYHVVPTLTTKRNEGSGGMKGQSRGVQWRCRAGLRVHVEPFPHLHLRAQCGADRRRGVSIS